MLKSENITEELLNRIWAWIRKHILRRKVRPVVLVPITESYRRLHPEFRQRPKAIHQDISKFMAGKGKGQHKWYRASVKARKKPEEED